MPSLLIVVYFVEKVPSAVNILCPYIEKKTISLGFEKIKERFQRRRCCSFTKGYYFYVCLFVLFFFVCFLFVYTCEIKKKVCGGEVVAFMIHYRHELLLNLEENRSACGKEHVKRLLFLNILIHLGKTKQTPVADNMGPPL